jgi:predicted transposase YbfD/YdcC
MDQPPTTTISIFFGDLPDPRIERTKRHGLLDILTIAICAMICGAEGATQIALFGNAKETWFRTFLKLPHGIPSHDTFGNVLANLDPAAFERCFMKWVRHWAQDLAGEVVPIDGKALRRSFDRAARKNPLHLVSAWASESGLSLGQVATADKSNEITAIPQLLTLLDIRGASVTIDAMGCQKAIAQQIVDQKGDYVLAVKDNQPTLHEGVQKLIAEVRSHPGPPRYDYQETTEKGHGRLEVRRVWCTEQVSWLRQREDWPDLHSVAMVESQRTVGEPTSVERRYYISSHQQIKAQRLAHIIRRHWAIENELHWSLDVAFDEDRCRVRKGHGDRNLALLRKIALNLLKQEKTAKVGIPSKRLKAGWDHTYLLRVLAVEGI